MKMQCIDREMEDLPCKYSKVDTKDIKVADHWEGKSTIYSNDAYQTEDGSMVDLPLQPLNQSCGVQVFPFFCYNCFKASF